MTVITSGDVRQVTDAEVAFYAEHGWVKLDGLVSPELAAEMLAWAQGELAHGDTGGGRLSTDGKPPVQWHERRFVVRDDRVEPFRRIGLSRDLGRNAQRMTGRQVPVRYWTDIVTCKIPVGLEGANERTGWHQDLPTQPHDRVGIHTFWIALDEVLPEQGSMRFVDGSHRIGPLGRTYAGGPDQLEQYPELLDTLQLSPPLHLRPGDATCHASLTVHGAPANSGANPRWAFLLTYFPSDVRFTGAPYPETDKLGLTSGSLFEHPRFPVVYP